MADRCAPVRPSRCRLTVFIAMPDGPPIPITWTIERKELQPCPGARHQTETSFPDAASE
jgi:hypothetical protein